MLVSLCNNLRAYYRFAASVQKRFKQTHFGFEPVDEEKKWQKVYEVFENVATRYDLMNDAMSCGVHRLWKDEFVRQMHPLPTFNILDCAGGTGDIAFRAVAHSVRNGQSLGSIFWIRADAECLPFEAELFDIFTIAFGIRNCTHIDRVRTFLFTFTKAVQAITVQVIGEAYRVLKPGGRFMCLEFSHVQSKYFSKLYDWYSFNIIPVLGKIIANDWNSYQYLVESIRQFPNQERFAEMIEMQRFKEVSYNNLCNGVVAIHSGYKL
ncbi:2-methoxy-6-polyprenyl-1,4-benzoquinol methylase, mitochondrial [Trichinella pseudospiralis]|uniref:2-methoxy-6-polyprenyl-1,4-benzoquinol methylase, mitochondrial n=1 Tax=Trichinella pseudospiralis TaxID=6337 RepID=A0A0V1K8Z8_TRIPS|nr:2-methoxy-6-polyprenyl-1,4-benzoquinol methylase, mitochondrial [Trichinella pseudospiralis]